MGDREPPAAEGSGPSGTGDAEQEIPRVGVPGEGPGQPPVPPAYPAGYPLGPWGGGPPPYPPAPVAPGGYGEWYYPAGAPLPPPPPAYGGGVYLPQAAYGPPPSGPYGPYGPAGLPPSGPYGPPPPGPYGPPPQYQPPQWGPPGPPAFWPPPGFEQRVPPPKGLGFLGKAAIVVVAIIVIAGGALVVAKTASQSPEASLDRVATQVERLRRLKFEEPVVREIVSKEEMARRVREQIEMEEETTATADAARLMKFLHVIPEDMDLAQFMEDLMSEGVLGYYDDEKKELVVAEDGGADSAETRITLAHEYTHALADQHFDFPALRRRAEREGDSEAEAALDAVIEGDATVLMFEYALRYGAGGFGDGGDGSSAIDSAPRFIRESVLFPYEQGSEFVDSIKQRGGWSGVDNLYASPPVTTEQILHPEKYRSHETGERLDLGELTASLGPGCDAVEGPNVIGEFDTRLILQEQISALSARRASEGWNGDEYLFASCAEGQVFGLRMAGDTERDIEEIEDAWTEFAKAWTGGAREGAGGSFGSSQVRRSGDSVLVVLASAPGMAERVAAGL